VETTATPPASGSAVIDRLLRATNDHDLDALAGCFASDYVNETPAHPARGFGGREQVRRNWAQIFAAVPDLIAEIAGLAEAEGLDGQSVVWTEWQMNGNRVDGMPHLMRGVIIFTVTDDRISAARFYLEPVETGGPGVDAAVASQLAGQP
jgi:ketosteroid isomerase-like protein